MADLSGSDRYQRISEHAVRVGECPIYDIRNRRGDLIWKRGQQITDEIYQQLIKKEFYFDLESMEGAKEAPKRERTYERVDLSVPTRLPSFPRRLDALFTALRGAEATDVRNRILGFVEEFGELCERDLSAVIGMLALERDESECLTFPLHACALAWLVARERGMDAEARRCLMGAALTQDIGCYDLQKKLSSAGRMPDQAQLLTLRDHPRAGAKALIQAGVTDRRWLKAVLCHHESLDGSGNRYSGAADQIPPEARAINAIAAYIQLMKPRANAPLAAEELYAHWKERRFEGRLDAGVLDLLFGTLGAYPPGALVTLELRKGEHPTFHKNAVAVVTHPCDQCAPGELTSPKDPRFFANVCIINDDGKPVLSMKNSDLYLQQRRIIAVNSPRRLAELNKELAPGKFWS